jgi:hypothetical protein
MGHARARTRKALAGGTSERGWCRNSAKGRQLRTPTRAERTPLRGPPPRIDRFTARGSGRGRTETVTQAQVNRFHAVAKLLSGRAGRPPSFSKFMLPIQDRPSICFKRLGA